MARVLRTTQTAMARFKISGNVFAVLDDPAWAQGARAQLVDAVFGSDSVVALDGTNAGSAVFGGSRRGSSARSPALRA